MKSFIALALVLSTLSSHSFAKTVTAQNTEEHMGLCYFKQVSLANYPIVNIVGDCSWDLTLNGMNLKVVAVNDPSDFAKKIELGHVRGVTRVTEGANGIVIEVSKDDFNRAGDQIIRKETISLRSLNVTRGTFDVTVR